MKKKITTVFMAFMLISVLVGCGSDGTRADEYVNEGVVKYVDTQREFVEQMNAAYGAEVDATISAEGDAVVFAYQYNVEMTDEEKKQFKEVRAAAIDGGMNELQAKLTELHEQATEDAYIIVRYTGADGSELYSQEIK